jgi:hypothetical protein
LEEFQIKLGLKAAGGIGGTGLGGVIGIETRGLGQMFFHEKGVKLHARKHLHDPN